MVLLYKKKMPLASPQLTECHAEQQFNVTNVRFGSEANIVIAPLSDIDRT
jgi:hypothetical protein